jgi:hypothetical protein
MQRTPADRKRRSAIGAAAAGWSGTTLPPTGAKVCDPETGRSGILMAVDLVMVHGKKQRHAFVRPVGGGVEWSVPTNRVQPAEEAAT